MNLSELTIVVSPLTGMVGGLNAAKSVDGISRLAAGSLGLGVGIASYALAIGLCTVVMKVARLDKDRHGQGIVQSLGEWVAILPIFVAPVTAYWAAGELIALLSR